MCNSRWVKQRKDPLPRMQGNGTHPNRAAE